MQQQGHERPNVFSASKLMETHSLQSAACVNKARIGQLGASYLLSKACLPVCGKEIMWHWAMYVCVSPCACMRGCVFISGCAVHLLECDSRGDSGRMKHTSHMRGYINSTSTDEVISGG